MSFLLVSYNILADSYINPAWYPRVPRELLAPARRLEALCSHVAALGADALCLQEVEPTAFAALEARLAPLGYACLQARKGAGKPDGCATFLLTRSVQDREHLVLPYADGQGGPDSGHVAQLVAAEHEGRPLVLANTHLRWSQPGRPSPVGARQLAELLGARGRFGAADAEWVVCGDFNLLPGSTELEALRGAGFLDAHAGLAGRRTCYANGAAKAVDYIWHTPGLQATPAPLPRLDDDTPLPSEQEPSDHVALRALLRFA